VCGLCRPKINFTYVERDVTQKLNRIKSNMAYFEKKKANFKNKNNELIATGELIANDELTANDEIIANDELTAYDEIIANDELTANDEIIANGEIIANDELTANDEIIATGELIATDELIAAGEIIDENNDNIPATLVYNQDHLPLITDIYFKDEKTWLKDIHIDTVLEFFQQNYKNFNIVTIREQQSKFSDFSKYKWDFENKQNLIFVVLYESHWIVLTNVDTDSKIESITKKKKIYMYESFNDDVYVHGASKILNLMNKYGTTEIHKVKMNFKQVGMNDCGLFALAYVNSLLEMRDPSLINYDQIEMRKSFNNFIDSQIFHLNIKENYTKIWPRISKEFNITMEEDDTTENSDDSIDLIQID
jgi:hypothetical protein